MKTEIGIVLVDHGSRVAESNSAFEAIVARFGERQTDRIIEAAHMELASPTLAEAFARAVARGATHVIVQPYFLLPGRHWRDDIPRLTAEAARNHPGVTWIVTKPLGDSPELLDVIARRIDEAIERRS